MDFDRIYSIFNGRIPCREGCSECCKKAGDVVLFPGESARLFKHVPRAKKHVYTRTIKGRTVEIIKQPCPFLKKGRCSIEENRPLDCRLFPFDYCIFRGETVVILSQSCPVSADIGNDDRIRKDILDVFRDVPRDWIGSSVLFGSCCDCGHKKRCALASVGGFNLEW